MAVQELSIRNPFPGPGATLRGVNSMGYNTVSSKTKKVADLMVKGFSTPYPPLIYTVFF
jgi:GMP synthase PP-ATPase subunit